MDTGIGNKIKNIRELRNYTQDHMAEKLGITQAGYSKIERGETDVAFSKLEEIASILEVSISDLVSFDGQKYFNSFNNVKGSNNGSVIINDTPSDVKKLYEDKIALLEKLLLKTETELNNYKDKFGEI